MYYDLGQWSIVDGTKVLIGDCVRFLESGYANKGRIDVYIDLGSIFSDDLSVEHEEEDEIFVLRKYVDPFWKSNYLYSRTNVAGLLVVRDKSIIKPQMAQS